MLIYLVFIKIIKVKSQLRLLSCDDTDVTEKVMSCSSYDATEKVISSLFMRRDPVLLSIFVVTVIDVIMFECSVSLYTFYTLLELFYIFTIHSSKNVT